MSSFIRVRDKKTGNIVEIPIAKIGKSAYEIALKYGFEGTEEEWLESLIGPKGDKGDKGDPGDTPINGIDYFTPEEKAQFIQEILAELGAAVIGYIDGNTITLKGNLTEDIYIAYYEKDGELVNIGELTLTEEPITYTITWKNDDGSVLKTDTVEEGVIPVYTGSTPTKVSDEQYNYTFKEWSPTIVAATADAIYTATYNQTAIEVETYTVTFVADDTTVATVTYEKGATSVEEPTVPEKAGYTGAWEPYTLNDTNITVNAVYTAIEVEPSYTNLLTEAGYTKDYKISVSSGAEASSTGAYVSGYIPIQDVDHEFYIKNITLSPAASINNIVFYDEGKTKLTGSAGTVGAFTSNIYDEGNGVFSLKPSRWAGTADAAFFRFSCGGITDESIVTENEPIE